MLGLCTGACSPSSARTPGSRVPLDLCAVYKMELKPKIPCGCPESALIQTYRRSLPCPCSDLCQCTAVSAVSTQVAHLQFRPRLRTAWAVEWAGMRHVWCWLRTARRPGAGAAGTASLRSAPFLAAASAQSYLKCCRTVQAGQYVIQNVADNVASTT